MIETTLQEVQSELIGNIRDPDATGDINGSGPFKGHNFNNPNSKPSTLARALARAVYFFIDEILRRVFSAIHPHSSIEEDLHEHLKRSGLEPWKTAIKARHNVRVGNSQPITVEQTISQGQIIYAPATTKVPFRLLDSIVLSVDTVQDERGLYTVPAIVECLYDGNIGNVAPDSIIEFDSILDGIDTVYNPEALPLVEGRSSESKASVRSRLALSETEGAETMWTPPWYILETLSFTYVARAIFVSAKQLGREGEVQLLILGTNGDLNTTQLLEIENHFAAEERDPGGVAHVIAANVVTQDIDKNFVILFSTVENLPDVALINDLIGTYFYSLNAGSDFDDAGIINLFNTMPGYVSTSIDVPGIIEILENILAVEGSNFTVTAQVYAG